MYVSSLVVDEIKRIVRESEIMKYANKLDVSMALTLTWTREDDSKWPTKNKDGRQELEIRLGNEHISFEVSRPEPLPVEQTVRVLIPPIQTAKIGSINDVTESADPEGLRVFYYLVQDLKALVFSLISLHFKIKPI